MTSENPMKSEPLKAVAGNYENLDETLASFAEIQEALNYKQAKDTLTDLVARLDLAPGERRGLESAIAGLTAMLDKLERSVVQIAVFGMVGRGKSSLLNALLGQPAFDTGPLHGVTRSVQHAQWHADIRDNTQQVTLPGLGDSRIQLVDTPGIDEVDGETREALAHEVARQSDLLLFVIAGDMTQVEHDALCQLREAGKPMLIVFNKIDRYPEADRQEIYEKLRGDRLRQLVRPDEIVLAAAAPLVGRATEKPDGTLDVQILRGEPQIDDLKLKILEVLHREGKSLVALNTLLYADLTNEQIIQRKMAIREGSADRIIWNGVMTKAAAIALNPLTIIDVLSAAIVDVVTILALSKLYGIAMTQTGALQLLQQIALGMGGIGASELVAHLGLSGLKSLLGIAAPITGGASLAPYLSVALTQAAVAGVSTYAIGQIAKTYLANGASFGPDGPKAVAHRILDSLDETSILNRIKEELRANFVVRAKQRAR